MKAKLSMLVGMMVLSVVIFHGPMAIAGQHIQAEPPIQVVVVSGTNYEMGVQYGEQAAGKIAELRDTVWKLLTTPNEEYFYYPETEVVLKDIQVWTYYLEKHDPQLKEWLLGISQGCKNKGFNDVSYVDLVAIMVYPQEIWARPAGDYPVETGVDTSVALMQGKHSSLIAKNGRTDTRPISSCSAFAATGNATPDGEAMVTITGGAFLEATNYLILVAFPEDGERFIALTQPGRVATNVGMNSHFAWVMPASVTAPWLPCASSWGVTSEVYFHYLMQYCKSPEDAVTFLENTPKGGVTGLFLFADKDENAFIYEGGICGSAIRKPGYFGEDGFVVSTNHYNHKDMADFNLGFGIFDDTFFRYDTVFQKLTGAPAGTVDLNFAKTLWAANDWYDAETGSWNTVPVPNNFEDYNICYVPGNLCEGGEYQIIQFPAENTTYLQWGVPQGTSIENYWPEAPKPTGEYTKWQLLGSIRAMANAASRDAKHMIRSASSILYRDSSTLNEKTQKDLNYQLDQAIQAWTEGKKLATLVKGSHRGQIEQKAQMARWSEVYTNFATAQLYAQMVSTQLERLTE